jgi:cell division protein ZapE
MSLIQHYQSLCRDGIIQSDPEQLAALAVFQTVFNDLQHNRKSSGLMRLRKPRRVKGLYVWGGVGIGKTLLMDCFFESLPFPQKLRLHFHAFMQLIHKELKQYEGNLDPISIISKGLASKYRVICFDEFVVTDIVDAMLMGRLLKTLLDNGVCFVTTSNTEPDELYKNGLQRTSFLPAIALIKEHMHIEHIRSSQDYRLLQIKKSGVFFMPDDAIAAENLNKTFKLLAQGRESIKDALQINKRDVPFIARTDEVIWFNFDDICHIPRSQLDYLEIAKTYKAVLLSHVPSLAIKGKNAAHLFIRLIDVLYDARIPLILSSAQPIELIFDGVEGIPEMARTLSRLAEMQSEKYLAVNI